jgi:ornithine cyclodeaminase/alanine dehydrogenase-like protein (mu-crystallin family)
LSQALGTPGLQNRSSGIVLYKAIGVAMEDVALAEFVYRKLSP